MMPSESRESLEIDEGEVIKPRPGAQSSVSIVEISNAGFYMVMLIVMVVCFVIKPFATRVEEAGSLIGYHPYGDIVWGFIALSEGLFAFLQATVWPHDEVVIAINKWFVGTCIAQICWCICLFLNLYFFVAIFMTAVVVCQVFCALSVDNQPILGLFKYLFLRIPWSLHGGWATVMAMVDLTVWAENNEGFAAAETISVAITAVGFGFAIMTVFGIGIRRPDPIFTAIVAVGLYTIVFREASSATKYGAQASVLESSFSNIAACCVFVGACYTILASVLRIYQRFCMKAQGLEYKLYFTRSRVSVGGQNSVNTVNSMDSRS